MNRIYKVVFNKTLGAYTAVSELASFKGKKSVKAAVAVGLAGLMMAGSVSAAGLSGGKAGSPNPNESAYGYTGTVDGSSGDYAKSGATVKADAVTVDKDLYGGYDYAASGSESRAMASSSNTVTVTNGSDLGSKNVTGGTVSAANDVTVTSVTASGNRITVEEYSVANGGVLKGASVSGGKEVTGTLTVDGNTVTVTGKSVADTKFTSVYGADVYANSVGGDVSASGNKVSVSQAAIGSDSSTRVQGVYLSVNSTTSEGVNLKADKNEAVLTDVELASGGVDVYGADIMSYRTTKDVSLSENKVTLSKVTSTKGYVYGGYALLGDGVKGTLDVNKNEVTVTGKSAADTKFTSVYGAYVYANSVGGDVSASGNKVSVSQAAIGSDSSTNEVKGVYLSVNSTTSEGVNLKADKNEAVLTNVELASGGVDVYGADIASFGTAQDVSLSENKAILTNVTSGKGTVYGVNASLGDVVKGTLDVNGNEVTVTGKSAADTKFDSVTGANVYAGSVGGDVSASENKVTVSKAAIGDDSSAKVVQGLRLVSPNPGISEGVNLKADKNEVGLTDVALASGGVDVYGANIASFGTAKDVSLSENKAILTNVTSGKGTVYGVNTTLSYGVRGKLDANGNEATVTGKSVADTKFSSVYGANVSADSVGGDVSASGNKVTVSNAKIGSSGDWEMVAGLSLDVSSTVSEGVNLKAENNETVLTGVELGSFPMGVYGAYIKGSGSAKDVSLSENKATLDNVTQGEGTVYGLEASLRSVKGMLDATGNEVTVTGKSVEDTRFISVYGASLYAFGIGGDVTVSQNKASVSKANIDGEYGDDGYAIAADVLISGTADGKANVKVEKNTLTVKDTNVSGGLAGADVGLTGDEKISQVTLDGNAAQVEGSEAGDVRGAVLVVGLDSEDKVEVGRAEVKNNTATVSGSTVGESVFAAEVWGNNAVVTGNTVNVTDSDVEWWADGADVIGDNATVSGNTVNVGGNSKIGEGIYGGYVDGKDATLSNNTVNLSGNTAFSDGADVYAAGDENNDSTVKVTDNTVNVTDNVKLSNVDMYGRNANNQGSGNTLNLNRWKGEIKSVNYFDNVNVNTSSASKEQVVIGDLVKGNADTKITVNMDSQAARELNPADGTIAGGVREASKIVKLEKVDGSSEHDETIRVNMAEGDLVGNISADVTESGRISGLVEKENSIISSLRMIGANNFLVFRQQMNDLEKRMGDLRTMPQSDGAWARVVAGQAEYKGLHSTYKTVQAGADKRIGQFVIGATASYTDADGTMKRLGTDDKNYTYGIYGSWLGDNGHFVDVILKRHHVASEFDARYADGRKVDGSTHTSGTSLSVEYGKRFGITNTNFYVEPQVEVMWGKLDSDSYKLSNGVKVSQDSIDSFIGRLGVAAGWVSPEKKGSAYIKASVLNDWEADAEMKAKKGAIVRKFHEDMGGTWGEFVIGGTYNFNKNFSAYGEIETSAGNPTKTTYQASAGIRYSF